jgi:adenylate kinase family enzyme
MKTFIMIAGAPGSGKTTMAKELIAMFGTGKHYEADQYFTDNNGKYIFRPELLSEAHQWCQTRAYESMLQSEPVVIVANCFTKQSQRVPYLRLARHYGYTVHFIHLTKHHNNIHGVPDYVIERHIREFEPFQNM